MALKNFFYDLAISQAKKQTVMVDAVTEEAPIIRQLPMEPASHGLWNVYEEVNQIDGADLVDLDAPLPEINSEGELKQIDLSVLGGTIKVGEDKARRYGSARNYFASKMPTILRQTGSDTETSIIYNNLRAYAAAAGKLQDAGGVDNVNYSMIAVSWVSGEMTGLYDPEGFGNGKVFDMTMLNGGNVYEDADGRLIYGMRIKNYIGLQLVNERYISAIVNIDLTDLAGAYTALPTERQVSDMIEDARGRGERTLIYCHPKVLTALGVEYKNSQLRMAPDNEDYNTQVSRWDGIRFLESYNFEDGTETNVAVP